MRRLLTTIVLAASATLLLAAPAAATATARMGVQDDAWLRWGPGTLASRLATLDTLGVKTVRFTLLWNEVARRRPGSPLDPNDPAYDWSAFDPILDGLHAHGITPIVTLYGSPRWANGGRGPNGLPRSGFGDFAYAASKRYPWVRLWTVWNENIVAGGVTSPRKTASGMAPASYMTGMHAAHARLDAYAANPYPATKVETPFVDPCTWCRTLTLAHLSQIRALVTQSFGARKPLWLTEYGYQTNPPDRLLGVSPARQALLVGEAALRVWEQPGATVLIHFLVEDEPSLGGWQSGLLTARGAAKPAFRAFALPLAVQSRRGNRTVLWGQVRPGAGRRPYVIQRWTGRRWADIGRVRRSGPGGTFRTTIDVRRGTKVRLRAPGVAFQSPLLVIV